MTARKVETVLAYLTLSSLLVYFPVETWTSWERGLLDPFYVVDFIAMVLILWGSLRSLRARPRPAPEILCAAQAWAAANGWRATFWRVNEVREGGALAHGTGELWTVAIATVIGLVYFVVALALVVRKASREARTT